MPVPKQKWLALPKAKRGKLTYNQYVAWTQKQSAQRTQKTAAYHPGLDPYLNPMSGTQISREAHRTVTAQTAPIIKQITAAMNRQKALGVRDINQTTSGVTQFLKPLAGQMAANYDFSMGQERAGGTELANFMKNAGMTEQAGLAEQLNKAGLRPPSENFTASGAAAGASTLAHGVSALDQMAGQRAADVGYALKAPGISQRVGAFNINNLQKDYASKLADSVGQLTSQVPSMVNTTYENLMNREFQKSVARQGFQMDMANLTESQKKTMSGTGPNPISASVSNNKNDGLAYDKFGNPLGTPWHPKTPGGGAGATGKLRTRIDKASKDFLKLSQDARKAMITKLNPTGVNIHPFGPGGADKYIKRQRQQVVDQVYAAWKGRFPGQTPEFWRQQTAATLAAGGWKLDAANLGYAGAGRKPAGMTTVGGQSFGPRAQGAESPGAGPGPTRTPAGANMTPQRSSFTNAASSRAQVLARTRGWEVGYGALVNYIMDVGQRTGQKVTPQEAWKLAQFSLSSFDAKGRRVKPGTGVVAMQEQLGNPKKYNAKYVPYRPPGYKPPKPQDKPSGGARGKGRWARAHPNAS